MSLQLQYQNELVGSKGNVLISRCLDRDCLSQKGVFPVLYSAKLKREEKKIIVIIRDNALKTKVRTILNLKQLYILTLNLTHNPNPDPDPDLDPNTHPNPNPDP